MSKITSILQIDPLLLCFLANLTSYVPSQNWDFGILAPNVASDVEVSDVTLSDNRHGVLVNKLSAMQQEGHVYISDSLVIGESARTKCADPPHSNPSGSSYSASDPNIGIVGATFALAFSIGPPKPWDIVRT